MEDSVRSDGIVKKKSSSGCLIIKKKGQGGNGVGVGVGVGVGSSKEKKRPRMIMSDSGSSDEEVEVMKRKMGEKIHNGGVGFRRSSGDDRGLGRKGEFEREKMSRERFEFDKYNEFGGREASNEYRKGEFEHERKIRNNFEFDKYNEFQRREVSNEYRNADSKLKMARRVSGGSRDFGESGSWRNSMVQKRKHAHMDGSNSVGGGRNKGVESGDCMSKRELDDAEAQLPISLLSLKYQETPDKPIRLQGKNGVLKVMVNSMKKKTSNSYTDDDRVQIENRKGPRVEVVKKDLNLRPPLYSESKRMEKQMSTDIREENMSMTRQKLLGKRSMDVDLDLNETDTSLKLAPPSSSKVKKEERSSTENCITVNKKGKHKSSIDSTTPVSGEEGKKNSTGSSTPAKGKEGKVKGGGSTEKQKLRETIREMLLEAGWTIDYRPRRNRDYLDSVYINPSGTAYWSIIKAYDALQKQFNGQKSRTKSAELPSSFAPLSEDLISKLTRQTRKKIEEKMKKRREDGMSRNPKKSATKESKDAMDSDQPEETPYSLSKKNLKSSKDNMQKLHHETGDESSDDTCKQMTKGNRVEKSLDVAKNRMAQGIKSRVIGRCILRVRDSNMAQNSESDGYVPYFGKRTVLAWLVNSGIVQAGEKVQYMNRKRTRVKLEGWITKEGIHCGCCSKILTVAKFELHAGSKLRRPFPNIFLESGVSLLQCQIDAWNRQEESERKDFYTINVAGDDPDDDACGTCGDGGDLICCDSCPSTFHQSCLDIKMLPEGDWHCPNCVCKFCGTASRNDTGDNLFGDELTICNLCERKFHKSCSTGSGAPPVDSNSADTVFCGQNCQEIYDHVHNILGVKHDLEEGFSWSLIQRTDMDSDVATVGFAQRVECNSKLAVALSVMNECFLPISDRRSGINIIHNVFYNCGANFQRLNYRGFYTAVLERGDEIISVASIRIHGTQLAEMPFIGTRHIYRRQGMCRRLLSAIELVLSSFKVEKLIIPAISEHMHTWTEIFDFNPLEEDLKREIKSMNMLVFPGTDMLQKQLMKTTDVVHLQPTALARKSSSSSSAEDEDEGKDAKVLPNKKLDKCDVMSGFADSAAHPPTSLDPLVETASDQAKQLPESTLVAKSSSSPSASEEDNKDHVQSQMETEPGDVPEGIVISSGEDMSDVAKRIEDPDAQRLADLGGVNCVPSTVVSDEVDRQSTPYEVTINDHDMTDSAFDNIQTAKSADGNVSTSRLPDSDEYSSGSLCSILNKPGVGVKDDVPVLVSNTEVAADAEVAYNLDGSNVEPISFEHTPASVDLNTTGEFNEESAFPPSACGETINTQLCVEMSEMKSELDMQVSPAEAIPDSINVCLPHDAGEEQKSQEIIPVPHNTSTEILGENCVHSTIASDEVDIQSTPYTVAMKDHDMTDNIHTGKSTNGSNSAPNLEDAGKYSSGVFSSNLHKPGVGINDDDLVLLSDIEVATDAEAACAEGLMNTSSMYEVSNRDGNDVEPISFEAPASVDLTASGQIKEEGGFFPASEVYVKMSEMKSELHEASGLTMSNVSSECESNRKISSTVPDSIDVRLPYGAGEAHQNQETIPEPHDTMRVDSAPILQGIPEADSHNTDSGMISSEVSMRLDSAPILQGIPEADSHNTASETISSEVTMRLDSAPILQGIPEADSHPTASGTISTEVAGSIDPPVQSNNPTASRALPSEVTGSIVPLHSTDPAPSRAFSSEVTGFIEPPDQSNEKSNEVVPV